MVANGAFDLAAFDGLVEAQEAGVEVEIKGPDGKPLGPNGWRIRIAGPDSKRFRAASRKITQERVEAENLVDFSAEEVESNAVRILAECTLSWTPVILGGQELPCTPGNALRVYERYPFIREQLERKAGRRAAFFQPLAAESGAP